MPISICDFNKINWNKFLNTKQKVLISVFFLLLIGVVFFQNCTHQEEINRLPAKLNDSSREVHQSTAIETRACTVENGVGSQSRTEQGWSDCQVVSCNSGYKMEYYGPQATCVVYDGAPRLVQVCGKDGCPGTHFQSFNIDNINASYSQGFTFETGRQLLSQLRSNYKTFLESNFSAASFPTGWSGGASGTGRNYIVASGLSDPNVQSALQFETGGNIGSDSRLSRKLSYLPQGYGIMWLVGLTSVGSNMEDSAVLNIQNTVDNKALLLYHNSTGLFVQDASGKKVILSSHWNSVACEWWIQNKQNANGTNTITVYGGTEWAGEATVVLPAGNPANAGLVQIQQLSGVTKDRYSRTFMLDIGLTQLVDDMTVMWNAWKAPVSAQGVAITLQVEDVSKKMMVNNNFVVEIQVNNGAFQKVNLANMGAVGWGVVDPTKPVYLVTGALKASIAAGQNIVVRVKTGGGILMPIEGMTLRMSGANN